MRLSNLKGLGEGSAQVACSNDVDLRSNQQVQRSPAEGGYTKCVVAVAAALAPAAAAAAVATVARCNRNTKGDPRRPVLLPGASSDATTLPCAYPTRVFLLEAGSPPQSAVEAAFRGFMSLLSGRPLQCLSIMS